MIILDEKEIEGMNDAQIAALIRSHKHESTREQFAEFYENAKNHRLSLEDLLSDYKPEA